MSADRAGAPSHGGGTVDPAPDGSAPGGSAPDGLGRRGISRRGLVIAAGSALVVGAGAAALVLGGAPDSTSDGAAPPAPAPPSAPQVPPGAGTSVAAVLREAAATAGVRLGGSPWQAWGSAPPGAAWDGLWVAWLLRGLGTDPAATSAADLLALVRARGRTTGEPSPGALVFSRRGPGTDVLRVGLVVSVSGSAQTLEGDHPVLLPPAERFVRRFARPGPGLTTYGQPGYEP